MITLHTRRLLLSLSPLLFVAVSIPSPLDAQPPTAEKTRAAVLIPDDKWNCGMPTGIPIPEEGKLAFEIEMPIANRYDLGLTQYGHREVFVTSAGKVSGAKIEGTVLPGSLDLFLEIENGIVEIEQLINVKTLDGTNIFVRTAGVGASSEEVRIVFHFEAPNDSEYKWLHDSSLVGRRVYDAATQVIKLQIFDVPPIEDASGLTKFVIDKPENVPSQSWDYRRADKVEEIGEELIVENVTLGQSLMVGRSRSGIRNTIPITGGELQGKINGKVLSGGADYQQLSPPAVIDARYLWQTEDGEVILVRNAGEFGKLVPTFEANRDGKYAWLNDGKYVSSNPGMGKGGVQLKFYESR